MTDFIRYFSILILNFTLSEVSFALAYNVIPKAGTTLPKTVVLGTTQTAFYTVTNNTKTTLTKGFVKYLPQHVRQVTKNGAYPDLCGAQFTLKPQKSCTLQLIIRGEVKASNPDPKQHLFICTPHVLACAGTRYPLNVKALVPTVSGTVQSGGAPSQAIADAVVKIYRSEQGTAQLIGSTTTNTQGKFYLYIPPRSIIANKTYYAVASKESKINLMTIMGEKPLSTLVLNELTTVAAAYSMAQFIHGNLIYGQTLGLKIAAMMNANLVNPSNGNLSTVITSSPNANETNAMRALNSLANALVPCIRNTLTYCPALFTVTTFGTAPTNTLEAVLSIAHHPSNNVLGVYALGQAIKLYTPYLSSLQKPNAWTIAIKFNNTGSETCPFGGPAKVRFDKNGFLWITKM